MRPRHELPARHAAVLMRSRRWQGDAGEHHDKLETLNNPMTKTDLIEAVAGAAEMTRNEAETVV